MKVNNEKAHINQQYNIENNNEAQQESSNNGQIIAAAIFGVCFISILLGFTVIFPEPTASQYATYKTVLALSAAGVGAILPGLIRIELPLPTVAVRASGAIALFVVVFFFTPPAPQPLPNAIESKTTPNQVINGDEKIIIKIGFL